MGENKAFYQRQLADLNKNKGALEIGIGYALLPIGGAVNGADAARYAQFEEQKQDASNRIELIQELVATQKDLLRQAGEIDTAGKRLGTDMDAAYAALGNALADSWPETLADFAAVDYGAVLALKAKLSGPVVASEEAAADGGTTALKAKLKAIQTFLGKVKTGAGNSLANVSRKQVQHRLHLAASKLGRVVFESAKLDEPAINGSLGADILAACDRCKEIAGNLADLAERRNEIKGQLAAASASLKNEGANGTGVIRIADLKKQIHHITVSEDTLALQVGRAFADTVYDASGVQLKKPETAAKKASADHGDTETELVAKLADDGRVRVHISGTEMDIRLLELDHEIAGLAAKMVRGNEHIKTNQGRIAELTADIAATENMVATSNDLSQKLAAEREELAKKRAALVS